MKSLIARLKKLEKAIRDRARQRGILFQVHNDPRAWDQERREYSTLADAKNANPEAGDIWTVIDFETIDMMIRLIHGEGCESQPAVPEEKEREA
jgi:hypothetical protein